jgi:hypothetical protein
MRTTLDIEDDVLQAAKELAQRCGRTAGQVISDLARRSLNAPAPKRRPGLRGGVPVLASRRELITLEHVQKIQDEDGV